MKKMERTMVVMAVMVTMILNGINTINCEAMSLFELNSSDLGISTEAVYTEQGLTFVQVYKVRSLKGAEYFSLTAGTDVMEQDGVYYSYDGERYWVFEKGTEKELWRWF
jgi:hypothetical protein